MIISLERMVRKINNNSKSYDAVTTRSRVCDLDRNLTKIRVKLINIVSNTRPVVSKISGSSGGNLFLFYYFQSI